MWLVDGCSIWSFSSRHGCPGNWDYEITKAVEYMSRSLVFKSYDEWWLFGESLYMWRCLRVVWYNVSIYAIYINLKIIFAMPIQVKMNCCIRSIILYAEGNSFFSFYYKGRLGERKFILPLTWFISVWTANEQKKK